ncbi:CdiA C-terminal domain-containing protein [Acinetobacter nosocomialis]|uniref:CdiA C-terminal domain-containing protein n=1 Tax=Acinetobacter nosocomialis TaxID=106654 RepID=UPI00148F0D7A
MKTIMKREMKNNDMYSKKIWSSAVQLVLLSLILLLSQLTLAKDRIQYHIQNFDGSTLKVINEQGIVSQSYQYAPFGQQLQLKKPSNLKNPQAFVGGVQDANDLVYLKQRHNNPVLGRFYQPDPVTFISGGHGQINSYQYGWNDTYTFSDPSGLATKNGVSDTQFEQFMYDWWPGYKFGTGLYNSFTEGSNQFSFWEGVDVLSVFASSGAKTVQTVDKSISSIPNLFNISSDLFSKPTLKIMTGKYSQSEILSAWEMAAKGNNVVLRSPIGTRAAGGTSDLLVNGVRWDIYTPNTSNVNRIVSAIGKKNSQAEGIILDISKSNVSPNDLSNLLNRVNGAKATNIRDIIIINTGRK